MKKNNKIIITLFLLTLIILAWAPWMDSQVVHDQVFLEKARKDGTIWPVEKMVASEEEIQGLLEESRKKGVYDGVLLCDYDVMWVPFGRYVRSCEGGWIVTFYGNILP